LTENRSPITENRSRLFFDLYWGGSLHDSHSVEGTAAQVIAGSDVPLDGFPLPSPSHILAESKGDGGYRLFLPPGVEARKRTRGDRFHPVRDHQLKGEGTRRHLTLDHGDAVQLTHGKLMLAVYFGEQAQTFRESRWKIFPWIILIAAVILVTFIGFIVQSHTPGRSTRPDELRRALDRLEEAKRAKE
jgi:hypothetical protein